MSDLRRRLVRIGTERDRLYSTWLDPDEVVLVSPAAQASSNVVLRNGCRQTVPVPPDELIDVLKAGATAGRKGEL